jgi:fructokinase
MQQADARVDVFCLGEALVDLLPTATGPLEDVPSFERHPGGAPANVAIGLARLGRRSALIGVVGDDPFGRFVAKALASEGVDVSQLYLAAGVKTGLAFVSLDDAGRPRFYAPGNTAAELLLSAEQTSQIPFARGRIAHFSTALLRSESSRAATFDFVERARAHGLVLAFDPNLRLHHLSDTAPLALDVARLLPEMDVVKLSEEEISFVTGRDEPAAAARALIDRGATLAVVTRGALGAVWAARLESGVEGGLVETRPAKLVDTTGAGDGFHAALLDALARTLAADRPLSSLSRSEVTAIVARACEAGTRVCEALGAVAGLPFEDDLPALK